MHKVAHTRRFAAGTSVSDGRSHWGGAHADLARSVPGLTRYVQNHCVASLGLVGVDAERPAFDGYSCLSFVDRDALRSARATPAWAALAADAATLFDMGSLPAMSAVVEERTIVEGPSGPFKAVWFVRFKDEIRADEDRAREAHEYWTGTHGGAFGIKVPGIDRYVQNHVVEPVDDGVRPGFDGFSECWFRDRDGFDLTMGSDEWSEMNEDALVVFDRDWIVGGMSAVIEETVVV